MTHDPGPLQINGKISEETGGFEGRGASGSESQEPAGTDGLEAGGVLRLLRGGGFWNGADWVRAAYRNNGLWIEFPFADDYLRAVGPAAGHQPITEPGGKSSGKSSGKTEDRILAMVKKEPGLSIPQMAAALDITPRAVEKQIRQLKAIGRLRRVGPAKGCHWEVRP